MEDKYNINDISKEALTILSFFDNDMIKKIPDYVISKLCKLSADSKLDFYIDSSKSLDEQNISENCKNLIALIYYEYIAEDDEKEKLMLQWED